MGYDSYTALVALMLGQRHLCTGEAIAP